MTEGGDIGFRVYCKNKEEGTVELVPFDRIESHLVMEEGELICSSAGKCMYIYSSLLSSYTFGMYYFLNY